MRPLKCGSGRGRTSDGSAVFWRRPCFICVLCFAAFVLRFVLAMPPLLRFTRRRSPSSAAAARPPRGRWAPLRVLGGTARVSGSVLTVDHPRYAKLVSDHPEPPRPVRLLDWHLDRPAF